MTAITQITVTQATVVTLIAIPIIVEVGAGVEVESVVIRLVRIGKIISKMHLKMKVVVPWLLLY